MQGQEKLTFIVILFFFSITLCCTLLSANEKVYNNLDEKISSAATETETYLFPIKFIRDVFYALSNSLTTIFTMPLVLRRLTLAECCSWYLNHFSTTDDFIMMKYLGQL